MTGDVKITVGGDLAHDMAGFSAAWARAEAGDLTEERVLSFESWEALSSVLTGERIRLLRRLHGHPAASINALALSLKRQYRRVHDDVRILERAGLLDRSHGGVRATADVLTAEVVLRP